MKSKPFAITKRLVWEAWQRVKSAGGGPGDDGVTLEQYEGNLSKNLYRLWNRMSSGSYFPAPTMQVAIPKASGGERMLGIPTVNDRIAQTVVRLHLEGAIDSCFVEESYGSRPGKSAHQAVSRCRERCWRYGWVVDLDLQSYFDTINHELLMRAVRKHATEPWEVLYIERWLEAPVRECTTGELATREGKGIPQGATISPLLSNLFLHYALDLWLHRTFPGRAFERYLDDVIIHCHTKGQAQYLLTQVKRRLAEVGLAVNEEKTRIVRCLDPSRRQRCDYKEVSFTFLGFDFKPRKVGVKRGKMRFSFTPGVGTRGKKGLSRRVRAAGAFRRTQLSLEQVASLINPIVRGWCCYFGAFRPSEMHGTLGLLNRQITGWLRKKYKISVRSAVKLLRRITQQQPTLFYHWTLGVHG